MGASLEELAEDAAVHLLWRPTFELVDRDGYWLEAGSYRGSVQRIRLGDVEEAVAWTRAEALRRRLTRLEWWVGWSATPRDLSDRLPLLGLVPDETPTLTGMTCEVEPPPGPPEVEIRPIRTLDEQLATLREVDWQVWDIPAVERVAREVWERRRFDRIEAAGTVHHFVALLDGRRVGFGRAIDMAEGVALMGGAVLPEARGRGVYRALVRARFEHAAARGTPVLVAQASPPTASVLEGLGFRRHGEIHLFADPGVASRHGDD